MKTRRRQGRENTILFLGSVIISLFLTLLNSYSQDKPPECTNLSKVRKMIVYPDSAKEWGIEGRVIIKVLVEEDGNVVKTGEITGPIVFYNEIKRVCMFLKFTPPFHDGEAVKCWVSIPFNFKLKYEDEDDEK